MLFVQEGEQAEQDGISPANVLTPVSQRYYECNFDVDIKKALSKDGELMQCVDKLKEYHAIQIGLQNENIKTLRDENSSKTVRIDILNKEKTEIRNELNATKRANGKLLTRIDVLEKEVDVLKNKTGNLESEIAGIKSENARIKSENAGMKSEIAGMKSEIARMKSEIAALKEAVKQLSARIPPIDASQP